MRKHLKLYMLDRRYFENRWLLIARVRPDLRGWGIGLAQRRGIILGLGRIWIEIVTVPFDQPWKLT